MGVDLSHAEVIIRRCSSRKSQLIPILQEIQEAYGYVPGETIEPISKALSLYPVEVYGVLTFYTQFRLKPRGKHTIRICQGTACHVMGGKDILDYLTDALEVQEGQTTDDGLFSIERVACLGCCGMAPVVMIDENFYGRCTVQAMGDILDKYRLQKAK